MKVTDMIRFLFMPRDFDRDQHMDQLRRLKEAKVDNLRAARSVRRALKAIDVGHKLDDMGKALDLDP